MLDVLFYEALFFLEGGLLALPIGKRIRIGLNLTRGVNDI